MPSGNNPSSRACALRLSRNSPVPAMSPRTGIGLAARTLASNLRNRSIRFCGTNRPTASSVTDSR